MGDGIDQIVLLFLLAAEMEVVRDIKEKHCYIARDFDKESESYKSSTKLVCNYELPDGKVIAIGDERIRCSEALFKPALIGEFMYTFVTHRIKYHT